jgi:AbiV family abortive infection protein
MKPGGLEEYRGRLTSAEAADGMNAAARNARQLAADAKLLLDAERYPTAAALAGLSIEESGKVSILRELATETTPEGLRDQWRRYRDHRSKNGAWLLPELAAKGARRLGDLAETVNRDSEHTALLNIIKQIGLYTDCYRRGHWSEPVQVIDANLARSLVRTADILAGKEEVTAREMELWVEHVRPVWRTPEMAYALLRWATAMYNEGLTKRTPESYARFLVGELAASDWSSEPPTPQ